MFNYEDDFITNLLIESIEGLQNEDKVYTRTYNTLSEETEDFTSEGGTLVFDQLEEATIAKSILEEKYPNVELEENEEDMNFVINFNNEADESYKKKKKKEFRDMETFYPNPDPSKWVGNRGTRDSAIPDGIASPAGDAGAGEGGFSGGESLELHETNKGKEFVVGRAGDAPQHGAWDSTIVAAESYGEDDFHQDPYVICPNCGGHAAYVGDQGDFAEYNCNDCGAWSYSDEYDGNGHLYSAEEVWGPNGEFRENINLDNDDKIEEDIEKHDTLNPSLFEDNDLKPEVKKKLLEIVDKFKDYLKNDEVDLEIKDVILVGSNASYNYTKQSDIDLHILADLSVYEGKEDLAEKLYQAYKSLWNDKYDPTIYGQEVEVYVEPYDSKQEEN